MHRFALLAVLACLVMPQSGPAELEAVLGKAGQFVLDLQKVRLLVADENYSQVYRVSGDAEHTVTTGNQPQLGEWSGHMPRRMKSQFVLMANVDGEANWLAFRDAYEVDGRKLRDDRTRLERVFAGPIETALPAADLFSQEAIKHNRGRMAKAVHPTTLALTVLSPAHQAAFTFTKKGEKKADGATVWVIGYAETTGGRFARTVEGRPQPLRGEVWIDPRDGHVVKTQLVMDTLDAYPDMKLRPERYENFPRMIFDVTYGFEPKLKLWLPSELKENYDRQVEVVTTEARYSNYRILQGK